MVPLHRPYTSSGKPATVTWNMAGARLNFELDNIQIHQFQCIKPDPETGTDTYPLRPWWDR